MRILRYLNLRNSERFTLFIIGIFNLLLFILYFTLASKTLCEMTKTREFILLKMRLKTSARNFTALFGILSPAEISIPILQIVCLRVIKKTFCVSLTIRHEEKREKESVRVECNRIQRTWYIDFDAGERLMEKKGKRKRKEKRDRLT